MVIYDIFHNDNKIKEKYKIYEGSMNIQDLNNVLMKLIGYGYEHITFMHITDGIKYPMYKTKPVPVPQKYIRDYYLLYELFKKIGVDTNYENFLEISKLIPKGNVVNIPEAFYKVIFDMNGIKKYHGIYECKNKYDRVINKAKSVLGNNIKIDIVDNITSHFDKKYDMVLLKYIGMNETIDVLKNIDKILNKNSTLIIEYEELNVTPIYEYIAKFDTISIFRGKLVPSFSPLRYIICQKYNNGVVSKDFLNFIDDINNDILDEIIHSTKKIKLIWKKIYRLNEDNKIKFLRKLTTKHINISIEWCYDNKIEINSFYSHGMKRNITEITRTNQIKEYFPIVDGIDINKLQMTYEAFYSVTRPKEAQIISELIKERLKSTDITITDGSANVGGNTINFATNFKKVHSIELDSNTCSALKNNVDVYNLKNVEVHCDDFLNTYPKLKQDAVFFDPPWGGKGYKFKHSVDLYLSGKNISHVTKDLAKYTKLILIKVPHNFNLVDFYRDCGFNKMQVHRINKFSLIILSADDLQS